MHARHELPAYSPLSARDLIAAAAARLLRSRRTLDLARSLIARAYGADDVVLVDSGRSALQLAIDWSLPLDGDRVVAIPAFQCYEVASAAVGADCRIALYDVDPVTLQPDLESLERALRLGAKSVVIAPLYGLPVDWDAVDTVIRSHGALAIEDAAQAHGAEWRGRRVGALGDVSVVSFGRGKGWTGGRGGALLLRSATVIERARSTPPLRAGAAATELSVALTTAIQLVFGRPSLYGIPAGIPSLGLGETRYHVPGVPVRAHPFSAALLTETARASDAELLARRRNAEHWNHELPRVLLSGVPPVVAGGVAGYLRYPVRLPSALLPVAVSDAARRSGIARSYPLPLGQLPDVAARLVQPGTSCAGAVALSREIVTLPTHSRLTPAARARIIALLSGRAPAGA